MPRGREITVYDRYRDFGMNDKGNRGTLTTEVSFSWLLMSPTEKHHIVKELSAKADKATVEHREYDGFLTRAVTIFLEHSEGEVEDEFPKIQKMLSQEDNDVCLRHLIVTSNLGLTFLLFFVLLSLLLVCTYEQDGEFLLALIQ